MSLPSIFYDNVIHVIFCGGRSCLFPLLTCNLICVPCILRHIESYQETYLVDPNGSHLSWALVPCAEAGLHSSRGSWISFQFRLLHHLFTLFVLMGLDDFLPEILNDDFQQTDKRSKRSKNVNRVNPNISNFEPKKVGWQETTSFQIPENSVSPSHEGAAFNLLFSPAL